MLLSKQTKWRHFICTRWTDQVELPPANMLRMQPDTLTSVAESLECMHQLVAEGKVGQIGLSNYSAVEVERCLQLCDSNGDYPLEAPRCDMVSVCRLDTTFVVSRPV